MNKSDDIQVIRTVDRVFAVNSYCLGCNGRAVLIDPIMTEDLEQLLIRYVVDLCILTHEHYDHICGINDFRKKFGCVVKCGRNAARGLVDPSVNLSKYIQHLVTVIPFGNHAVEPLDYICSSDDILEDQQMIIWQGHTMLIKETPGHSAGSIAILVDEKYLFSGDTVFKDYPTATRMPGGSTKAYKTITVPWLDSLPQDIKIYPGHGPSFPLKERY